MRPSQTEQVEYSIKLQPDRKYNAKFCMGRSSLKAHPTVAIVLVGASLFQHPGKRFEREGHSQHRINIPKASTSLTRDNLLEWYHSEYML
jgi:hypothetical protein